MRVKSSGLARGLANPRPPGSATFVNAPPPGLTRRANALQLPGGGGGGGWAQVELTDALGRLFYNQVASFKLLGAMVTKMVTTWRVETASRIENI